MQCAQCNREFFPDRDDAITCGNRCRQARFRHRHRKPRVPAFIASFPQQLSAWFASNPLPADSEAARQALLRIAQEMDT